MTTDRDIVIIGAGFGGVAMAIALTRAGYENFRIYEKAPTTGGVWRDNTYPGIACDVPSVLYSFSFEQDYPWSRRYAPGDEIRAYIDHCAEKHGVAGRISFNAALTAARFDGPSRRWSLTFAGGETVETDILVSAMGLFNKARLPDIPGVKDFKGPAFHSSEWRHDIDLAEKKVAVIGTGASAIQFVPAIAPKTGALLVFQRSAQYVTPMIAGRGENIFDPDMPLEARQRERRDIYQTMVENSARRYSAAKTQAAQDGFLAYLKVAVPDPELRQKLTPRYPFGCKRVLRSDDWYPALQRDNVDLIDAEVTEILPDGVIAAGREYHDIDILIFNTGFRTTEYLSPVSITSENGCDIHKGWQDGPEAFLGMTVTGFPNFFMLYGPNTNLSGSIVHMLECQARYIARAIKTMDEQDARTVMVRADRQRAFNAEIQEKISRSTMTADNCLSYFQTEDGKVVTQWPGSTEDYTVATAEIDKSDFLWR